MKIPFGQKKIPRQNFQNPVFTYPFRKKNFPFALPQGEPVFTKNNIKLKDVISKLKINSDLVLLSVYILPNNRIQIKEIINLLVKKKIRTHFMQTMYR